MSRQTRSDAMPTVLVTGAAGALARRVIQRLAGEARVIAADVRRRALLPEVEASYHLDMSRKGFAEVFVAHRIDAVIHIGRIFTHEQSRVARYNANVLGTRRLLDLCCEHGVRQVVLHSTYLVYGARPDNPSLIVEGFPGRADERSGDLLDAVELERLAESYAERHPELGLTLLRACNVVGPGVRNTVALLLSRPVVPVLIGASPAMQFLHVDDMATAVVSAYKGNRPGVYNVASDEPVPLQAAVLACGGVRLPVLPVSAVFLAALGRAAGGRLLFPGHLLDFFRYPVVPDDSLFRRRFGWAPRIDTADIFLDYHRQRMHEPH